MRVVMVELVVPGRFFAGMFFPFALGLLRARGVPAWWLRMGVPAEVMLDGCGEQLDEVARSVARAARDHDATHALFSHVAATALAGALRQAVPSLRLGLLDAERSLGPHQAHPQPPLQVLPPDQHALLLWIGASAGNDADLPLVDLEHPDYGVEPANAAARELPPLVYLLGGPLCAHRPPLEQSRFFAGRDLDLPARWGCSFCAQSVPTDALSATVELATLRLQRQLAGLASTLAASTGPLRLLVVAAPLQRDPAALARLVLEQTDLPPCRLLLGLRADEIVASEDALLQAARALHDRGHRLDVNLVGVESFSARQLDRYHKGYGPEVNLAAVHSLRALEARCPEAFGFSEHGGLSTILYDPWATPADVALNLAVARHFELAGLCGKLLTSRLRLTEEVPLARVARHDGLLAEAQADDPLLRTAQRNFYAEELPWRFADRRLQALNRLTTRLQPEEDLGADPLHEALERWRRASGLEPLEMAEALTRATMSGEEDDDPETLLERARTTPARAAPVAGNLPDVDPVARWFRDSWEYGAICAGAKAVTKLEDGLDAGLQDAIAEELARRVGGLTVRTRTRRWDHGETREMFLGADSRAVDEVVALMEARDDPAASREAVARTGVLLGYPECCARAFAESAAALQDANGWLLLRRRLETPGEVAPEVNPCLMPYVPCSLECAQTRELTRRVDEHRHESWRGYGGLPTLVFLGRTAEVAVLRPLGPVDSAPGRVAPTTLRLDYEGVVPLWLDDERRRVLEQGDALELEPGLIRVLRQDREVGWFALEAFLWSHVEAFHGDFWRACLDPLVARAGAGDDEAQPVEPVASEEGNAVQPPGAKQQRRLALRDLLLRALERVRERHPEQLRGFTVDGVETRGAGAGWGELELTLRRDDGPLVALITPADDGEPAFARSGPFAVSHSAQTPAHTRERQQLLTFVVGLLQRVVARC